MHRVGELFIALLLVWGLPCFAQADALKRAGQAVHGSDDHDDDRDARRRESHAGSHSGGSRSEAPRDDDHHHYRADPWRDDEDDEISSAAARGLAQVLLFPWTLPAAVVDEYTATGYSVPVYPYADEFAYSIGERVAPVEHPRVARWSVRAGMTTALPRPQLVSGSLATQVDFSVPLSIHLDYRLLMELPDADGGERSYAGLGNAELLYRFAEARSLRFFSGAGYMQWADPAGLGHGLGLVYGFEAYPVQPISFGSRVSIGVLGESYAFQWRSHLGVLLSRYELQLAYDHVDVGGVQLGGVQLSFEAHL